MASRSVVRLAALAAGLWVTACSPALDWRQVRPEGAAVVALFPCKPERRTRQVVLADQPVALQVLGCTASGTTWGLSSADLGDAARIDAALRALRQARSRNLDGRETAAQPLRLDGMSPNAQAVRIRVAGRRPDGSAVTEESALFARGTRVFHAAALGGNPSSEALETFFGNLKPSR